MPIQLTEKDVKFKSARSSGPGGSRANRRATKAQVWVSVEKLPLSADQKKILRKKLPRHRLNHRDEIEAWCEEERSQAQNRRMAIGHLNALINSVLKVKVPRIPTAVPRSVKRARREEKKMHGRKKALRSGRW